jgi:hypothetical protein
MSVKYRILVFLVVFAVSLLTSVCEAVGTRAIDRVRGKSVLDEGDFRIIEDFVSTGVQELVRTKDFTSIAKIRTTISGRANSKTQSAQAQYAEKFSEFSQKYISDAFNEAEKLTPSERKFKIILNLLILVDVLEDLRLVDLAMNKLNDENKVIRYWAVHSITNSGILKQLNSTEAADLRLARDIVERLKGMIDEEGPEITGLMAEFAGSINIREGEDLLVLVADMRIKKYADWTVDYELLDMTILKVLYDKISSESQNKSAIANRFVQLLSYVMQRYFKGRDVLNDTQRAYLASVLVEIEKSCISKLLMAQSVIKNAIERGDYMTLSAEHGRLIGDETKAGNLAAKLNIDYGKNPDGSKRTASPVLPEPPN